MLQAREIVFRSIEFIVWVKIMRITFGRWETIWKEKHLFFFSKPTDAVCPDGTQLPYPMATANLHHEVELIVAVGRNGTNIPASGALDYVFAYAVGLDLTRRDLQKEAKKKGRPWLQPKVLTDLPLALICIRWMKLVT